MRSIWTVSLALVIGCGASKDNPTPETPADNATNDAPAQTERVEPAQDAACEASGDILLTKRTQMLNGNAPETVLTVHDNGHWSRTGSPKEGSGCLSGDQLGSFKTALDAADIAAPPLAPDMARCMAMPISSITVEAKGSTATWQSPCGGQNPSPTLGETLSQLSGYTTN